MAFVCGFDGVHTPELHTRRLPFFLIGSSCWRSYRASSSPLILLSLIYHVPSMCCNDYVLHALLTHCISFCAEDEAQHGAGWHDFSDPRAQRIVLAKRGTNREYVSGLCDRAICI